MPAAVWPSFSLYHFLLIRGLHRDCCFREFRHNSWVCAAVFLGTVVDFAFR
jgi:hypothetical protein